MSVRRRPARGAPGQHFLRSSRLASALVEDAGVGEGDLVVEIGAGTGMLTNALAAAGARVVALELDPALVAILRRRVSPAVDVLERDALHYAWPDEPFAVVSNLPFAGGGAILARLLDDPRVPLRRADVIVQWEAAVKLTSIWPATLAGSYRRAWYQLSVETRLARSAFSPAPAVDAALVRVERRGRARVALRDADRFRAFLEPPFRSRAPLRSALPPRLSARELKRLAPALGFSPGARARDLSPGQWARLFAFARERGRV